MKANEAPEKIYVHIKDKPCEITFSEVIEKECSNIEYTRTDAFMKKAENFLEMLGYGFTITDNITHANYDKEQLIADFEEYLKK